MHCILNMEWLELKLVLVCNLLTYIQKDPKSFNLNWILNTLFFFYKNVKFWLQTRDFLNFPFSAQKCFLFLGIPRAQNILNFGQ